MLLPVSVTSCGFYHPYWYQGERNPHNDELSRQMMDFKDEDNRNHQRAINRFSELAIDKVGRLVIRGGGGRFVESPFSIAIVPSHTAGRISPALIEVAERVVRTYRRGNVDCWGYIFHFGVICPLSVLWAVPGADQLCYYYPFTKRQGGACLLVFIYWSLQVQV